MKKRIALILAMTLCLSLAACGGSGSGQTAAPEPEETPAAAPDPRQEQYEAALAALENEDYAAAYAGFEAAGDYEDAAEYLGRFTVEKRLEKETWGSAGYSGECTFAYSPDGKLLSQEGYSGFMLYFGYPWEPGWEVPNRIDYEYDAEGRLKTAVVQVLESMDSSWMDQTYLNECIEKLGGTLDENGRIRMEYENTYSYSYDEDGKISAIDFTKGGYDPLTYTMEYGENGELIHVSSNGEETYEADLLYDGDGNLTMVAESPEPGMEFAGGIINIYEYDEEGRVTKLTQRYGVPGASTEESGTEGGYSWSSSAGVTDKPLVEAEFTYLQDGKMVPIDITPLGWDATRYTRVYGEYYLYNAA